MTDNNDTNIQLKDLAAAIRIIDECSKRGAFRGEELTAVGEVRDRISNFLRVSQEQAEQNQPADLTQFEEYDSPEDNGEITKEKKDKKS